MPIYKIFTNTPTLSDVALAHQLGQRLWAENDLQLDFTGIESVTEEFATELCRTILQQRNPAIILSALLTQTMSAGVQAVFTPVVGAAVMGSLPPTPESEQPDTTGAAPPKAIDLSFNPISALWNIQNTYLQYVYTFQKFTNPNIAGWVEGKIKDGTLLWRDPYIQLTRRFEPGDTFAQMVQAGLLHQETPRYFAAGDGNPIRAHQHQSQAIKYILGGEGANTIVATGTGSGKSFCFGIPIVSECLNLRDRGVKGIKAIIIYPMNALGNSQYADFARRLHGSGLKLALYTGDTLHNPEDALAAYRSATGRDQLYDSEIISREEIQEHPPDILMTNYVMLELLLTRFEDRRLFPQRHSGVLRFLVLDEVHTYTGKQGADVACLIRRLKQHTHTTGKLRCIATSATISSDDPTTGARLITKFTTDLFGEAFKPAHVVGEMYRPTAGQSDRELSETIQINETDITTFDGSLEAAIVLAKKLLPAESLIFKPQQVLPGMQADAQPALTIPQDLTPNPEQLGEALTHQTTLYFLENQLNAGPASLSDLVEAYQTRYRPGTPHDAALRELMAALLAGTVAQVTEPDGKTTPRLIPRLHAFFSQGRAIVSCLTAEGPHLSDRGDLTCPTCANKHGRERPAFPLNFCRACGQEYYSVAVQDNSTLQPYELDSVDYEGIPMYLFPGGWDQIAIPLPDNWLTKAGNIRQTYQDNVPVEVSYCPICNQVDQDCEHRERRTLTAIRAPAVPVLALRPEQFP